MKNKFTRLTEQQLASKCNFIENYLASQNAASGAIFDSERECFHQKYCNHGSRIEQRYQHPDQSQSYW